MASTDKAVIYNALVEVFGYEKSIDLRSVVESSPRFPTLLAIASHDSQFDRLKAALAKVVKNPKTRAAF
jgi:hypothetical protein